MTDYHGQGRWGTGDRPLGVGTAQSEWDIGARNRRDEEFRREKQLRDDSYRRQQEEQKKREGEYRRNNDMAGKRTVASPASDPLTLNDYLALVSIGGFVVLLVVIWNAIVGQFHPSNSILAAIVNHGVWAVGFAGLHLGFALKRYLMKIGKLILLLAALFFGSAIVYGLYQGFTGAG